MGAYCAWQNGPNRELLSIFGPILVLLADAETLHPQKQAGAAPYSSGGVWRTASAAGGKSSRNVGFWRRLPLAGAGLLAFQA